MIHYRELLNALGIIWCIIQSVHGDICKEKLSDVVRLVSTTSATSLQYVKEDNKYPVCYWLIKANSTYDCFINLQIKSHNGGRLRIYDGFIKANRIIWTSGMPKNVNSSSQNVVVVFSIWNRQATLRLSYKTVKRGDTCMTNEADAVRLVPTTLPEVLRYRRVGSNPYRDVNPICYWLIGKNDMCDSLVELQVESYNLGHLEIYDGPSRDFKTLWIPGMSSNKTSSSQYVLVTFSPKPEVSVLEITFKTVKKGAAVDRIIPGRIFMQSNLCYNNVPEILLSTYGPNYIREPFLGLSISQYNRSLECNWLIVSDCYAVIKLTFTRLSVGNDYVRIYDGPDEDSEELGTYSGNTIPKPIVSTGHQVFVTFIHDQANYFEEFTLQYENSLEFPVILSGYGRVFDYDDVAFLEVSVISYSPIRALYWLRNGNLLYNDTEIISDTDFNITNIMTPRYSTLSFPSITKEIYGIYKVLIQNEAGFSEKLIQLNKPSNCEVTFADYNVSMNSDKITIQVPVTFRTPYSGAKWFRENVTIDNDIKHKMSVSNDSILMKSTFQLEVLFPELDDYTGYKLSIACEEKTSEINIPVQIPDKYIPTIRNYSTNIERSAVITVSYESNPVPMSIQWEKDSTVLGTSDKYGILNDTNIRVTSLEIYSVNEADFGSYTLSITNAAATRTSYIDLNKPKVFPVIRTCSQFQTINISCTIEDCEESFLPWIHSINGTEIRRIAGHVTGLTSTLTFTQCVGEDIGHYTCVTEQKLQNGTKIPVTRDYSILSVYASPIIDTFVNVVTVHNDIQLSVNVTSNPPIRLLKWFNQGEEVRYGISVTEQPVEIAIRGTLVTTPGYTLQLTITNYIYRSSLGSFKVYVANDVGASEHSIQVDNPDESIDFLTEETSLDTIGDDISVSVTFFALPQYDLVSWTNAETGTVVDLSPRHVITTEVILGRHHEYVTKMQITDSRASDYTQYSVSVKNVVGHSEYFVTLKNPNEGPPVVRDEVLTTLDGNLAIIAVNFTSHPAAHSVMWFKDDTHLVSSQKYYSYTQELNLKFANAGSVEIMNGYQNQLQIASVNENDFGTYRVQLQNDRGYTEKLVILSADCGINDIA